MTIVDNPWNFNSTSIDVELAVWGFQLINPRTMSTELCGNRGVDSFPILSRRRDSRLSVLSIGRLVLRFCPRLFFSRLRVKARIQQCDECLSSTPVRATRRESRAWIIKSRCARARAKQILLDPSSSVSSYSSSSTRSSLLGPSRFPLTPWRFHRRFFFSFRFSSRFLSSLRLFSLLPPFSLSLTISRSNASAFLSVSFFRRLFPSRSQLSLFPHVLLSSISVLSLSFLLSPRLSLSLARTSRAMNSR